jgi:hypothetical protein
MIKDFQCLNGHQKEVFEQVSANLYCETQICKCGCTMGPIPTFGKGLCWIEEGRPRTFWNIGPQPVTVTSRKQYREALRKNGVREAGSQITSSNNNNTKTVRLTAKGRWI